MKYMLFLTSLLLLSCTQVTDVRRTGPNEYTVATKRGGQFPEWETTKGFSRDTAKVFCEEKGLIVDEIKWDTHGARGWTPLTAELLFSCVDENSAESSNGTDGIKARLRKLDELREADLLTKEEYDQRRSTILDDL